jgi:hypothetical protein
VLIESGAASDAMTDIRMARNRLEEAQAAARRHGWPIGPCAALADALDHTRYAEAALLRFQDRAGL